ncbi:ABC transporter permease [Pseudomonas sp. PDM23]|uniref:ABC transporter permease n=1 Tax=unclassified Pseudomonas TaxID=196821 RepID=UPI0017837E47|nr:MULTISPECIES: ABC transporter permease [unclassified Pseudomonas]MBD9576652.1 ABC transporter permease [Pseudomonas sp. PDM23]MBD9670579.1 ABC transporter permease [Pseudomonas sp. PDM21]
MVSTLEALYRYRSFILGSVKREFQSRYRRSMLGAAWLILQPLAMILIYTLVFSQVMRAKLPGIDNSYAYSIYLCAGVLTWGFFSEVVGRGMGVFIDNANMLKKLSFPRICLPAIISLSALMNFSIIFALFILFLLMTNSLPGAPIIALVPLLALQTAFALGLGITLGVLNVFFRDIGQFMGIFLQFWFWFTPIIYPVSIIPTWAQAYISANPMTNLITAYQAVLVQHQWPQWQSLWPLLLVSVISLAVGFHLFRKHSADMVDEL